METAPILGTPLAISSVLAEVENDIGMLALALQVRTNAPLRLIERELRSVGQTLATNVAVDLYGAPE